MSLDIQRSHQPVDYLSFQITAEGISKRSTRSTEGNCGTVVFKDAITYLLTNLQLALSSAYPGKIIMSFVGFILSNFGSRTLFDFTLHNVLLKTFKLTCAFDIHNGCV